MTPPPNLKYCLLNCARVLGSGRFEEAFHTLEQLKLLDTPHSRLLENDLAFLFLPDSSLEENELYWRTHKEIVAQRAAIWYALTGETQRAAENEIYDMRRRISCDCARSSSAQI